MGLAQLPISRYQDVGHLKLGWPILRWAWPNFRGLAVMRPACHLDTLFFDCLDTQNFMSEFAEDDFS